MARQLTRILVLLLLCLPARWSSAEPACPERLSMPDLAPLQVEFIAVLKNVYRALGCEPEILPFPGRRGIYSYNHGQVDGEAFRLAVVEPHYGRPFIRSAVPLFYFSTGVCSRPDQPYDRTQSVAYVRGVIWHEDYVGEPGFSPHERGLVFDNQEQVFRAYNNGLVDHFLCEGLVLRASIERGRFEQAPVMRLTLQRDPAYHYLNQSYGAFMQRFSEYLEREDPFAEFN